MEKYFESILMSAILTCEGKYVSDFADRKGFTSLYPFTTESISGYLSLFDLNNKSLVTVGSSFDQVFNAALYGCYDQTVVDICPYAKFYFYLKKAALIALDYNSFLNFFCYVDFPRSFKYNEAAFNINSFLKIKPVLRFLDYDSYLFWDELFSLFEPIVIRQELFERDEYKIGVLKQMNPYLSDENSYRIMQKKVLNVNPKIMIDDVLDVVLPKTYDNIFLSNILQYDASNIKILVDRLNPHLNNGGRLLISYLYDTTRDTEYCKDWSAIYDLDKTFELLQDYNPTLESFTGVHGFIHDNVNCKDSVLVYRKRDI